MDKIFLISFKNTFLIVLFTFFCTVSCQSQQKHAIVDQTQKPDKNTNKEQLKIIVGANKTSDYLNLLYKKSVGIVANQTSVIFKSTNNHIHLVDSLLSHNITIKKVFAPEHGFRGKADAGEHIKDGRDPETNIPIVSIYGKNKKPSQEQLNGLDVMVFDIQDVGARFYTYISSLHYIMEACAEAKIPLLILDRPNPNGHYIDGPILETTYKSFVGMHPIPVVHGMTIGEYAQMINGENWLNNGVKCDITIIRCDNYNHKKSYNLPIKPSPNLPNNIAINLYPSLCFFEGTPISVGRGTSMQFQIYGSPSLPKSSFSFIPKPNDGAKDPKHNGQLCYGKDLRTTKPLSNLNLEWLIEAYNSSTKKDKFFSAFFTKLAGTKKLQEQIEQGLDYKSIKKSWEIGLNNFKNIRQKYLLYN